MANRSKTIQESPSTSKKKKTQSVAEALRDEVINLKRDRILREAAAYMECKVVSRMEAADHWVIYSEVVDGTVFNDSKTATHHRKVASYY